MPEPARRFSGSTASMARALSRLASATYDISSRERAAISRMLTEPETLPREAQAEVMRTLRQEMSILNNLNREEEAIFWDGEPYMRGVYDRDNPRRANGRYRTRNGEPLPSEYARRQAMLRTAMRSRLRNIARRYNLL